MKAIRRAPILAIATIAALAGAAVAAEPLHVIVLVGSSDEEALATRIQGQTADVDAKVEPIASAAMPSDLAAQLAAARKSAAAHDADAVVWFRRDGDAWIVHVAEAEGERILVRRVQSRTGAMSKSAAIEAAAVIVRTAIRGLVAGGEIGVTEPEPEVEVPPPIAPVAIDTVPPPPPQVELGPMRPLRPFAELAWSGVIDGERVAGHHGVSARLGAAGGPWRIAAVAAHHPGAAYRSTEATIEVERQAFGVALGVDVAGRAQPGRAATWRIAADVALVMARFPRTTTATSPGLAPTAANVSWTPIATPALRVSRRVAPATWITLTLGADLVARPPEFGVASGGSFTPVASLWPVEPHAGLGVVVDPF